MPGGVQRGKQFRVWHRGERVSPPMSLLPRHRQADSKVSHFCSKNRERERETCLILSDTPSEEERFWGVLCIPAPRSLCHLQAGVECGCLIRNPMEARAWPVLLSP